MVADYYAMLGVEPNADRATIEAALAKCQPLWSSGTRNPKTKHTYQSYLDKLPELRRILLGDPLTRRAYDAELAAEQAAEREKRRDRLERLIRLRAAKGGLTKTDRKLLLVEAGKLGLTEAELDRLAQPYPKLANDAIAPAIADDPADPSPDVIDPTTRKQIRLALEHLRKRDLYDVLDVSRDVPQTEVIARADAERKRWMSKSQVTAEKTAWLEAVSYAQSHLCKPDARARYDRTLVLEAEEALSFAVEFALEGASTMDSGTKRILLDEAAGLGILPDRANVLIRRVCRAKGIALEVSGVNGEGGGRGVLDHPRSGSAVRWLRCRECAGLTDFSVAARLGGDEGVCRYCRSSLRWTCPVCQKTHWVDEARCDCGFRQENLEPLVRHFEAAKHAHRSRNYAAAVFHLKKAETYAPRHVGVRKGLEKIKEKVAEIERVKAMFATESARRRLVAARSALESWSLLVDPTDKTFRAAWQEVMRDLRDAAALCTQARSISHTEPSRARELIRQALERAVDLPDAVDAARHCPPDPPTKPTASFEDDRMRLRWDAPPADGFGPLTFRVLRKRDGLPAHAGDGVLVAETKSTECEDRDVSPGESVGYAVFSRRHEADSIAGATVGPLLALGEVRDLRVETSSREVYLFWKPPPGAIDVRVVRKRGVPPKDANDGDKVEALHDSAHDRDLEEGRVYHYGVFAIYKPANKLGTRISRGAFVSALPRSPAEPIEDARLEPASGVGVRIVWKSPKQGIGAVLRTSKPTGKLIGERLDAAEVEAAGGHWLSLSSSTEAIDPNPPNSPAIYYTLATAWEGGFTVGRTLLFSSVPDFGELRAERVDATGRVRARWKWKPPASRARLLAKAGAPPDGPEDQAALAFTVLEDEYAARGRYFLQLPADESGPWHLAVFGAALADGREVYSPGHDPTARTVIPGPNPEVAVGYVINRPILPGSPWSVTFHTEPPGASIPPGALVAHPRVVPLSLDEGEIIARFPPTKDGETHRFKPPKNFGRLRARVYLDPAGSTTPVRLRHPETGATRV